MSVDEQGNQASQDILTLELQAIRDEIKRLEETINAFEARIDARMGEMAAKIAMLDTKLETKLREIDVKLAALRIVFEPRFHELDSKLEGLRHEARTALEIRERLAALEAKVGITRP